MLLVAWANRVILCDTGRAAAAATSSQGGEEEDAAGAVGESRQGKRQRGQGG